RPKGFRNRRIGTVQQKVYRPGEWVVGGGPPGHGTKRQQMPRPTTHHSPPTPRSKGEKVGGRKSLNVRAHQQPGDSLPRQTPPGARPNKRAGLVRPATTLG